jgi:hypothetical protein
MQEIKAIVLGELRLWRMVKGTQDYILGYLQPSLAGLFKALTSTQD